MFGARFFRSWFLRASHFLRPSVTLGLPGARVRAMTGPGLALRTIGTPVRMVAPLQASHRQAQVRVFAIAEREE